MSLFKSLFMTFGISILTGWTVHADSFKHRFLFNGDSYGYEISSSQLAKSPKWNIEKEESPPVSASQALAKAKQFIGTIKNPHPGTAWQFETLSLFIAGKSDEGTDVWAWRASWKLTAMGAANYGPWPDPHRDHMDCYILMDGTVLQPEVKRF